MPDQAALERPRAAASSISRGSGTQAQAGRAILLAGPGSPILDAVGRAFAAAGAHVLTERDLLARHGPERPSAELVEVAHEELGRLDVLVRHVPQVHSGPLLEADREAWSGFVGSVLVEAFEISRAAARLLPEGGSIVHIASIDVLHAYPGRSAAAAAMSGLVGLVRALAVELAPLGVRVNLVIPGPIEELVGGVAGDRARTELRSPIGRLGTAAEVASGVLFLAGPSASFMTGQALRVDGGWGSLNQAPDGMKFR